MIRDGAVVKFAGISCHVESMSARVHVMKAYVELVKLKWMPVVTVAKKSNPWHVATEVMGK